MSNLPVLDADRVRLRPLGPADLDALYAIFSDGEVTRFTAFRRLTDRAAAKALLEEIQEFAALGTLFQWGVERRSDGAVVGTCTLAEIDREHRRAELGVMVRRDFWGEGYGKEAVARCLEYGFAEMGLHRVEADIDPRNEPSIRLVVSLGFVREGLLRDRWRAGDEWQDAEMFGLLEEEWRARSGESEGGSRDSVEVTDV